MSDHGHNHAPDHTPHVTPLKVYLATWGTLMVLTAITVGASYVNFGGANLVIALVIATIKAAVVAALFMHLLHDHKFHALVLVSGGLFLMIFVAFTMFDTEYRGKADSIERERPADITRPFEGTKAMAALQKQWGGSHAAASASAETHAAAPAASSAAPHEAASAAPAASGSASAEPAASGSASVAPSVSASVPAPASASVPTPAPASASASAPHAH